MKFHFFLTATLVISLEAAELPLSFEECLLPSDYSHMQIPVMAKRWDDLKALYEEFLKQEPLLVKDQHIPKILHQIWLGSPFPEKFKAYRQSFLEKHPDWTYILWTEDEIEALQLEKAVLYKQSTNFGEKSDIARYEILHRFGGVYIDTDLKALQSLDFFCDKVTFFAGISHDYFGSPFVNNAIIGSCPGHPILKQCIELLKTVRAKDQPITKIIGTTGPKILTRAIFDSLPSSTPIVILPTTFFYPFPSSHRELFQGDAEWIKPESFTIHYWNMSWAEGYAL